MKEHVMYSTGKRVRNALFGGIMGLIGGVGVGLYLTQTGSLDAGSATSLVAPVGGLLLGMASSLFRTRAR
ncbi:MAG: hypothetical protein ACYDGR_01525 [Candidatus Dormibacteria bacterium]